jgi:hypothetical protein
MKVVVATDKRITTLRETMRQLSSGGLISTFSSGTQDKNLEKSLIVKNDSVKVVG